MNKRIIFFFCFVFACVQGEARDPFKRLLPEKRKVTQTSGAGQKKIRKTGEDITLEVRVDGVFWGTEKPQAIIDGEVYIVGDKLKNNPDAVITKIENNAVTIILEEKVFIFSPKRKLKGL